MFSLSLLIFFIDTVALRLVFLFGLYRLLKQLLLFDDVARWFFLFVQ